MSVHHFLIRVYYEDTDVGGIVYHSNYLKFFERGRTESFRDLGFDLVSLSSNYSVQFVVHSAEIKFLKPASLDQLLCVITRVEEMKQASVLYDQKLFLEDEKGPLLCQAKIRVACLDKAFHPTALPEPLLKEIKK